MTGAAAPPAPGRRRGTGLVLAMAAFVVAAPPLLLLAPLLLLLLLSRPVTLREWLWIALAGVAVVAVGNPLRGGLPSLLVNAGAAVAGGLFAVVSHLLRRPGALARAGLAVAGATGAVVLWGTVMRVEVAAVDAAVQAELERAVRVLLEGAPADQLAAGLSSTGMLARLFPGTLALQGLGGAVLAWAWYHRVARRPIGTPPGPFAGFRFNDHLIWGAIFTLAATLLPLQDPWGRVAANGLVVWTGLYGARGLAVMVTAARRWPLGGRVLLLGFAIATLPLAVPFVILIGLADTWLDFRRRRVSPSTGGTE